MPAGAQMKIAYLTGRYPAVSHTFVMREVQALRRLGLVVETMSIHRSSPEHLLSAADRAEFESTFAVLPPEWPRIAAAVLRAALTRPRAFLSTLGVAMRISRPGLRGRLWELFYLVEAVVVWDECRRRGVRHVHAQFANQATDAALLVAHLGGPGWSWSLAVHGPMEFYDVTLNRLAEKVRRARLVVCISDFARSQLMALVDEEHWAKLHVVHCGVDVDDFAPPHRDGAGDGWLRVLCVGRLVHLKGPTVLVEAIAELKRRGVAARATLIGEGPKRADLEGLVERLGVEDRVVLTGSVGQDTIRSHYGEADVFCLPSFGEGVPVVLMEAMAMALPVVTTRITGVPELVDEDRSGLLVTAGRRDELVDALEALANDPERRSHMGAAGREKVAAEFELHSSAARLYGIYVDALGGGRPAW